MDLYAGNLKESGVLLTDSGASLGTPCSIGHAFLNNCNQAARNHQHKFARTPNSNDTPAENGLYYRPNPPNCLLAETTVQAVT
ncbi:hypothetical protein DTL42_05480 [Bremerella cremea]|uniref:Uncharacterized protein n=2 Tax=Bremerella cremea TaxID=1031537 RepID=A0A368KY11_9BACT|nr:hypothetical protein DTL42_05480 [Bremerella cremea]